MLEWSTASYTDYLEKLWQVFREVKRVLKPSGTCWVVIDDTSNGIVRRGRVLIISTFTLFFRRCPLRHYLHHCLLHCLFNTIRSFVLYYNFYNSYNYNERYKTVSLKLNLI